MQKLTKKNPGSSQTSPYFIVFNPTYNKWVLCRQAPPIKYLAFMGGGVKGEAHVGGLKALEEQGLLDEVEGVAGSSAGAIIALALALGLSATEIAKLSAELDLKALLDPNPSLKKGGIMSGKKLQEKFNEVIQQALAWVLINSKVSVEIQERVLNGTITFADLELIRQAYPDKNIRKLKVTATNITDQELEYFSNETTPDMSLALAVRISGSFPKFFQPVEYKGKRYIDGGVTNNLPANAFGPEHTLETLAFFLENKDVHKTLYTTQPLKLADSFFNNRLREVVSTVCDINFFDYYEKLLKELREVYAQRTVILPTLATKTLDFDISNEEREVLRNSGKEALNNYLALHQDEVITTSFTSFENLFYTVDLETLKELIICLEAKNLPFNITKNGKIIAEKQSDEFYKENETLAKKIYAERTAIKADPMTKPLDTNDQKAILDKLETHTKQLQAILLQHLNSLSTQISSTTINKLIKNPTLFKVNGHKKLFELQPDEFALDLKKINNYSYIDEFVNAFIALQATVFFEAIIKTQPAVHNLMAYINGGDLKKHIEEAQENLKLIQRDTKKEVAKLLPDTKVASQETKDDAAFITALEGKLERNKEKVQQIKNWLLYGAGNPDPDLAITPQAMAFYFANNKLEPNKTNFLKDTYMRGMQAIAHLEKAIQEDEKSLNQLKVQFDQLQAKISKDRLDTLETKIKETEKQFLDYQTQYSKFNKKILKGKNINPNPHSDIVTIIAKLKIILNATLSEYQTELQKTAKTQQNTAHINDLEKKLKDFKFYEHLLTLFEILEKEAYAYTSKQNNVSQSTELTDQMKEEPDLSEQATNTFPAEFSSIKNELNKEKILPDNELNNILSELEEPKQQPAANQQKENQITALELYLKRDANKASGDLAETLEKQKTNLQFELNALANDIATTQEKRFPPFSFGGPTTLQKNLLEHSDKRLEHYANMNNQFEKSIAESEKKWLQINQNLLSSENMAAEEALDNGDIDTYYSTEAEKAKQLKNTRHRYLGIAHNLKKQIDTNKNELKQIKVQFTQLETWIYQNNLNTLEQKVAILEKDLLNYQNQFSQISKNVANKKIDTNLRTDITTVLTRLRTILDYMIKEHQATLQKIAQYDTDKQNATRIKQLNEKLTTLSHYQDLITQYEILETTILNYYYREKQQEEQQRKQAPRSFQPETQELSIREYKGQNPSLYPGKETATLSISPVSNPQHRSSFDSDDETIPPTRSNELNTRSRSHSLASSDEPMWQLNPKIIGKVLPYHKEKNSITANLAHQNPISTKKTIASMALAASTKFAGETQLTVTGPKDQVRRAAADLNKLGITAVDTNGKLIKFNRHLEKHAQKQYIAPGHAEQQQKSSLLDQFKYAAHAIISH